MTLYNKIKEYTDQLTQKGLLRSRQVTDPEELDCIQFDSNDYLSLTQDKRIAKAYQDGYTLYPSGSGSSMLLSGYHANHQALEKAFAELLNVDDCILFSSGYAANLAITALLGQLKANCFIDKGIHASIYDGLALSKVKYTRFIHNDMKDLALKLNSRTPNSVLITEGIFSMSGQIASLDHMSSICKESKSELFVDEAHSFGVIGSQGKGGVDFHSLSQNEVPLRVIPFGKTLASQGAIIAGKKEWINALLQAGRSVIYSTAISPALCYGLLKTLDIVVAADERRVYLNLLIEQCKDYIKTSPLSWMNSNTPIQQLQLGCPHLALYYAKELRKLGISCSAIRAPTVTTKTTGLRIILNYKHQPEHILKLFNSLDIIYDNTLN